MAADAESAELQLCINRRLTYGALDFGASLIAVVRVNDFKLIIGPKLRNVLTSSHLFKFQELKECERKQDCVASSYSKGISPNQLSKNKTAAVSCQTAGYLRAR